MLHRYEEALDAENTALQRDPKSAATWSAKGRWLYYLDRPLEALAAYDEAIRLTRVPHAHGEQGALAPVPALAQVHAEAVRGRAHVLVILCIRGILPDGIELAEEADLNDSTIWREAGEMLAWQRHEGEALTAYTEALARNPYDFDAIKPQWAMLLHQHHFLSALKIMWFVARHASRLQQPNG